MDRSGDIYMVGETMEDKFGDKRYFRRYQYILLTLGNTMEDTGNEGLQYT